MAHISRERMVPADATIRWWVWVMVLAGALLMVAGAIIAMVNPGMLASPHDEINGAVRVYAGYMASRNFTLGALLVVALVLRAKKVLSGLMLLTAFIQLVDAGVDCAGGRLALAPGVVVFGLSFLLGAWRVSGYPFWRIEAWR
jgi:hypothetical protein